MWLIMDIEALASLESQKRFCHELVQNVVDHESFILLSGDTGSGRTVVCEQIVNETDSKMRAVFIPCHRDMQLQRLRELFLQQLLPNSEFDPNVNLPDTLLKAHIPYNHKILVVVDDVDSVVSSFYNELLALHEQFLGQARFSFLLVCHPLWADEKVTHYTGRADVKAMHMPALSIKEAMLLSRHMFALQSTMRIYNAISNKLPDALAAAKGNISQVIAITEKLMKEPTTPTQVSNEKARVSGKSMLPKIKKKSSSVGIFVTIVCIIIVLVCLIPIFFGGSFFSSDEGTKSHNVKSQIANEEALVFDKDNNGSDFTVDDGVILQNVPNGIDAQPSAPKTEHSVTLSGKDLEKIEGGANNSAYPRGVGGSLNNAAAIPVLRRSDNFNHVSAQQAPAHNSAVEIPVPQNTAQVAPVKAPAAPVPTPVVAEKRPNVSPMLPPPDPQMPVPSAQERKNLEQAAINKINQDRAVAAKNALQSVPKKEAPVAAKKEQEVAKEHKKAPVNTTPARAPLKAGQVINLADEARAAKAQQQQQQQAAGKGEESSLDELKALSNTRYTIQIVSGSNRANVAAAARGLSGRYWIVPSARNGKPWYILMAGDYASREEASAAARNIPRSVSQGATPFAKRVADAKAEIK